jgi:phosphoserine phosphatase
MFSSFETIKDKVKSAIEKFDQPMALFDLDGTLVRYDTSEAVYAYLIKNGYHIPYTWFEYQDTIKRGQVEKAYRNMITCLAGLKYSLVQEATVAIMESDAVGVEFEQDGNLYMIPLPRVYRKMRKLVEFIRDYGVEPLVISASCDVTVKEVANRYFDIPPENAYGVAIEESFDIEDNLVFSGTIIEPCPILQGKAEVYCKFYSNEVAFAAGDSINDRYLLELVDRQGEILLIGDNMEKQKKIAENLHHSNINYFNPLLLG